MFGLHDSLVSRDIKVSSLSTFISNIFFLNQGSYIPRSLIMLNLCTSLTMKCDLSTSKVINFTVFHISSYVYEESFSESVRAS